MSPDTNPTAQPNIEHEANPAANPDTNPFSIPIGTSDPINLCEGLPLVPRLGMVRAGATGASRSEKLLDVGITILVTRINFSAYYSWGFGVCGPSIGFLSRDVDVLRENVGNRGQLTLTFNEGLEMQAGLFVGAYVGIGLTMSVQLYLPGPWWKVWSFAWRDAFALNVGYTIDLISLLVQLIQHILSRFSKTSFGADNQNRLRDTLPDLKQTFAMVDAVGSRDTVERDLTATPQLTLPFNLVNYFPPLKALNDSLGKIGGEVSVGPSLLLQFPVKFNFRGFTVQGGLEGRNQTASADYGAVDYNDKVLTATGPTRFETDVKPLQFTSNVRYESRFTLGLSAHFKVVVAKFFNVEVNSASLDLSYLLTGVRQHLNLPAVDRSVSTGVQGSCVLTPNMTLVFTGSNGSSTKLTTGQPVRGTLRLPGFTSDKDAHVTLEIEPRVSGFPNRVTIPANSNSASFEYTFQNQCLSTGNRSNPTEVASPSPVTPLQTYAVSARLPSGDEVTNGCTDYNVQVPLNIEERYIRCQRLGVLAIPGSSPPWDDLAGVTLHADAVPGQHSRLKTAFFALWFPYAPGEEPGRIQITFTLLNENRQPHSTSNVTVSLDSGTTQLRPSARGGRTPGRSYASSTSVILTWNSKGPSTGYSNRFYLTLDAGCRFGQTEVWLDVWNWA